MESPCLRSPRSYKFLVLDYVGVVLRRPTSVPRVTCKRGFMVKSIITRRSAPILVAWLSPQIVVQNEEKIGTLYADYDPYIAALSYITHPWQIALSSRSTLNQAQPRFPNTKSRITPHVFIYLSSVCSLRTSTVDDGRTNRRPARKDNSPSCNQETYSRKDNGVIWFWLTLMCVHLYHRWHSSFVYKWACELYFLSIASFYPWILCLGSLLPKGISRRKLHPRD